VEKIRKVDRGELKKVAQEYFTTDNLTIATVFPKEEKEAVALPAQPLRQEEEIEKIILPSGLTILLKENRGLPIVSICSYFLAGVRTENENNNGISNLTAQMLLAGTKSRKAKPRSM
jgi:zinc protease